nr:hypothetical protein [Saprospiraceae bacterium]
MRYIFLIIISITLFACKTTKPDKTDTPPEKVETGEDREVVIDIIDWKKVDEDLYPPITYPEDSPYRERIDGDLPMPELKSLYYIAVVLPMNEWPEYLELEDLYIEEEEESEDELKLSDFLNDEAIGFLNGLEKTFKGEEGLNVDFKIEVIAGGEDATKTELIRKLNRLKYSPNLIIGSGGKDQLEAISEYAAEHEAVVINPWFVGDFEVAAKSQVVSFQPELMDHFFAVLHRLNTMGPDDKFYIVSSPRERGRVAQFKTMFEEYYPDRIFGEIYFDSDREILEFNFEEVLEEEHKTFFFIPMTRNHPFVYPILRTIDLTKASDSYEIIGLTLWDREIQTEFHQKLNLINTSSNIALSGNEDYIEFTEEFYNQFNYIGGKSEYEGKVVGDFVRRNLALYGVQFPYYLPFFEPQDEYFRWQFRRDFNVEKPPRFKDISKNLRNSGVYLLQFQNGKFVAIQ